MCVLKHYGTYFTYVRSLTLIGWMHVTAGERGIFDSSSKAEWAVLGWPFIFSNEVTNRLRKIGHLDNDR